MDSVGKDNLDSAYVSLKSGRMIFGIQCFFEDEGVLAALEKGQAVRIRGLCDGVFGNVMVKGRRLVQ